MVLFQYFLPFSIVINTCCRLWPDKGVLGKMVRTKWYGQMARTKW